MLDKIWRFLKTSPQDSNAPSPPMGVPSTLTDVEKGEGVEEVDREAKVWYNRGNEQYNLGDFEDAIAFYDKAL
ncbi:tetratricopeptide repeat protein [Microcoleus sp. LEGE 07076]|uniref:tetratricopeptide repeat protein n=1 Tax=Microcoleus sp. LEGE 07076 TaxID=915322 RepID=UPI001D1445DE|nr:tetratricopeptide repeat protein [Microcoleus sp. LEGE 07076]